MASKKRKYLRELTDEIASEQGWSEEVIRIHLEDFLVENLLEDRFIDYLEAIVIEEKKQDA